MSSAEDKSVTCDPFMARAIDMARQAEERGEVPVGAVLVQNGQIIAGEGNKVISLRDPSAHAEILVLRKAALHLGRERLYDCDLYVSLEPCTMCAGAIALARIRRLYFAAGDAKSGAVENGVRFFNHATCHHRPEWYSGIAEREATLLLRRFFSKKRASNSI